MRRIVWDQRATQDLHDIARYISRDSENSARKVVDYIANRASLLATSPELGRAIDDGTREFILTRYRYVIVYDLGNDDVRILAIFHHAQDRR